MRVLTHKTVFSNTINMNQDIIKVISACADYLASSAATFVAFQKKLVARIEEERLCSEKLLRIALVAPLLICFYFVFIFALHTKR